METLVMTDELNMDALMAQSDDAKSGSIIEGTVVSQTETHLVVNVGLKQDALLPLSEFGANLPKVGSPITVLIIRVSGPEGHPLVSWKQARELKNWDLVSEQHKKNELLEGKIVKRVKGGLIVDIGLDAFLPASQIDLKPVAKPEDWVGQTVKVHIIEMDPVKHNVLVSRRKFLEQERAEKRTETIQNIKEGQVIEGTVNGLTNFGAFVDIGGIEGLLHVSDMAWNRIDNPKTVVKIGDKITVKVLKFDTATSKISLGRKQLLPHPWDGLEQRFPIGTVIAGKVTGIAAFGAFVQIEPGIEGLIHISELSWTDRAQKPKDVLKSGQKVDVKIIGIDRANEKISLSLKRAGENPWVEIAKKYPRGSQVEGEVSHLAPFGAFVKIPEGMEALLKAQDISWTDRIQSVSQILKVGDKVKAIVLDVNPSEEKMSIGLKQLSSDPLKNMKVGQTVTGVVTKVIDGGVFLKLESGVDGFIRNNELNLERSIFADRSERFQKPEPNKNIPKVGDSLTATVTKLDKKERKIDLSVRRHEQTEEKELLKKYSGQNTRLTLGEAMGWGDKEE